MSPNWGTRLGRGVGGVLIIAGVGLMSYLLVETRLFTAREQELPAELVERLNVLLHAAPLLFVAGGLVLVLCRRGRESRPQGNSWVAFGFGAVFLVVATTLALKAVRVEEWLRAGVVFLFSVMVLVAGWRSLGGNGPKPSGTGAATEAEPGAAPDRRGR